MQHGEVWWLKAGSAEVGDFLRRGHGPEQQALLRLIGGLVEAESGAKKAVCREAGSSPKRIPGFRACEADEAQLADTQASSRCAALETTDRHSLGVGSGWIASMGQGRMAQPSTATRAQQRRQEPQPEPGPVLAVTAARLLEVADLTETPDGLRVSRSKTDQEGQGAERAILRGCRLRPVDAAQTWLGAAEIYTGPVFRPVLKRASECSGDVVPPPGTPVWQ